MVLEHSSATVFSLREKQLLCMNSHCLSQSVHRDTAPGCPLTPLYSNTTQKN